MKYLFIGYIYDQDAEKFLLKKNGHHLQPQNNQYAWGIINGLNECTGANVDVIGSISCGSYPKNSQMLIVKRNFFVSSYGIDYVGFINFYDIREMCRYYGFLKKIRKYIKETNDEITIIVDGMCHTFTKLIHRLKREYKDRIKIVLIVLDLVGKYAIQYPNKFQNWYYQRHAAEQMEAARLADGYILLTEAMKGPLNIGNKPYTVIEGFLPKTEDDTDLPEIKRSKNKVVLYTGSLNKKFGLIDLLEQFVTIDDDSYELWICGPQMGDIKIVEAYAKKDRRIKYLGFLPKSKILKLQRQATVLVNPRSATDEFTKYSFPSKTMEYMLSGTPVVMYKLAGIPDEYDEYLNYFDVTSKACIKDKIVEICEMSLCERGMIGNRARQFILTKSNKTQMKKFMDMMKLL